MTAFVICVGSSLLSKTEDVTVMISLVFIFKVTAFIRLGHKLSVK